MVFVDLFAGGGSTAGVVTLDTVADEIMKMADGVTKVPVSALLQTRDDVLLWRRIEHHILTSFRSLLPTYVFRFLFFL